MGVTGLKHFCPLAPMEDYRGFNHGNGLYSVHILALHASTTSHEIKGYLDKRAQRKNDLEYEKLLKSKLDYSQYIFFFNAKNQIR